MKTSIHRPAGVRQRGAAAVEFALVAIVFLALIIAVIEFSMLMYVYSSAIEATRLGARIAVVCDVDDATVKARMKNMLSILEPRNISISYPASGCSAATCDPVTVRIQNLTYHASIPLVPLDFPIPDFATSLPRESLSSADNPLCGP
ncbi:MAG TPA: TadE family protein [Rhodocyclaceae bacterium]|nr:TadE family protein [Rhodocyclaceae bacterium]